MLSIEGSSSFDLSLDFLLSFLSFNESNINYSFQVLLLDNLVFSFLLLDDIVESLFLKILFFQITEMGSSGSFSLDLMLIIEEDFFLFKFLAVSLPVFGLGIGFSLLFLEVVEVSIEDINLVVESLDGCFSLVDFISESIDLVTSLKLKGFNLFSEVLVGSLLSFGEDSDSVLEVIDILLALFGELVQLGFQFSDFLFSLGDLEISILDLLSLLVDDILKLSLADLEEIALVCVMDLQLIDAGSEPINLNLIVVLFHSFLSDKLDSFIGVSLLVLILEFLNLFLVCLTQIKDLIMMTVF